MPKITEAAKGGDGTINKVWLLVFDYLSLEVSSQTFSLPPAYLPAAPPELFIWVASK